MSLECVEWTARVACATVIPAGGAGRYEVPGLLGPRMGRPRLSELAGALGGAVGLPRLYTLSDGAESGSFGAICVSTSYNEILRCVRVLCGLDVLSGLVGGVGRLPPFCCDRAEDSAGMM